MNKKKGFLRLTLVLSIIVGVLSGVIGYISAEQPNPFDNIIPDTKLNFTPNLFPDTLPLTGFVSDKDAQKSLPPEQPVSIFRDILSKITVGILWLIIGFTSVWIIYGFVRWCIINLTTWIIAGFKTS